LLLPSRRDGTQKTAFSLLLLDETGKDGFQQIPKDWYASVPASPSGVNSGSGFVVAVLPFLLHGRKKAKDV